MRHHHEEPDTLQHHIRIDIEEGIASQFDLARFILLNSKLIDARTEIGRIVFGEECGVGS